MLIYTKYLSFVRISYDIYFPSLRGSFLVFWWCFWNSSFDFSWSLVHPIVLILFVFCHNICQQRGWKYLLHVFFCKFYIFYDFLLWLLLLIVSKSKATTLRARQSDQAIFFKLNMYDLLLKMSTVFKAKKFALKAPVNYC